MTSPARCKQRPTSSHRQSIYCPLRSPLPHRSCSRRRHSPQLLRLPGMADELWRWMLRTAQRPQPVLAFSAALSVLATALGQKVRGPTGVRTNLYMINVADTGSGKEHQRNCIDKVFAAARKGHLLGGDELASAQGLLARMFKHSNSLFLFDEFGLMLQAIRGKNAASHLQAIPSTLMELFSSTDRVYRGAEYADQKLRERQDIAYPCANIYATTTGAQLWPALGTADMTSGYLNRMLFFFAPEGRPARQAPTIEGVPETVVEWVRAATGLTCGLKGALPENPVDVHSLPEVDHLFEAFDAWLEEQADRSRATKTEELWARAYENAHKLALILSLASSRR